MTRPLWALVLGVVLALTTSAEAQESIFDPENPAVSPSPSARDTESGPENIFDPENEGVGSEEGDPDGSGGFESIFDPENADDPLETHASPEPSSFQTQGFFSRSWFTGSYLGRFYADTGFEGQEEDIFLLDNRLSLRAKIDFSADWTAVIEGRLEHRFWGEQNPDGVDLFVNGEHYQGVFEPSLRDAYLSGRFGNLFLTIGNQSIVWGAGTLTQPSDVINPLDYRGGPLDSPAEQRVPIFAVESTLVIDRLSLTAVLVPFFVPHRFDVFGTDFAFFTSEGGLGSGFPLFGLLEELVNPSIQPAVQANLVATEFPEAIPENMSGGARVTSNYGGVDLGVGYFFGWDRTPFFELDEDLGALLTLVAGDEQFFRDFDFMSMALRHTEFLDLQQAVVDKAAAGETLLRSRYRRRHTVEVDFVTYFGQLGVRVESALTPKRTIYLDGMEARRFPVLNNALALSYERSDSLMVHVEGFWVHTFNVPENREILLTGVDYYGAALVFMLGLDEFSGLNDTEWENLSFRFAGIAGISGGDFILYPSATWSFSDAASLSAGAMVFMGPSLDEEITLGGLYDQNDQAYISVDAAF